MRNPAAALENPSQWTQRPIGKGNVIYDVLRVFRLIGLLGAVAAFVVLAQIVLCPFAEFC